jgi:hypothetical protein
MLNPYEYDRKLNCLLYMRFKKYNLDLWVNERNSSLNNKDNSSMLKKPVIKKGK